MAMLEADPRQLEDPAKMKLLWSINDRLVTVQWYLQKSIIAMMEGEKEIARNHIDTALNLYPDHQASLLFKQKIDAVHLKVVPKNSKSSHKKIAMDYQESLYQIEDRILTITLNRPDKMNAFKNQTLPRKKMRN